MTRATDQDTLWSRVEDAGLNAIAPPQQRWVDGWLVRFSPGKAQRARCINAVSSGRLTLAQRLEVCREIYLEQGLPMLVRITPFSQPASLDAELHSFGYILDGPTCVMFCSPIPDCIPRLSNVDLSVVSARASAHIGGTSWHIATSDRSACTAARAQPGAPSGLRAARQPWTASDRVRTDGRRRQAGGLV